MSWPTNRPTSYFNAKKILTTNKDNGSQNILFHQEQSIPLTLALNRNIKNRTDLSKQWMTETRRTYLCLQKL
jgi:hypothetical protein